VKKANAQTEMRRERECKYFSFDDGFVTIEIVQG